MQEIITDAQLSEVISTSTIVDEKDVGSAKVFLLNREGSEKPFDAVLVHTCSSDNHVIVRV